MIDSADYNGTNIESFTFPNYKDTGFTGKWADMRDSVAFPIDELPSTGKAKNRL